MATNSNTRVIEVAGRDVAVPLATYRRIQSLLNKGDKIGAIVMVRQLAGVQLKPAKAAIENPSNFDQSERGSVDRMPGVDMVDELRKLVTGQVKPRQWMALHPQMAGGFGVSLMALSLMIATAVAWGGPTYSRHQGAWYYDLASGQLFSHKYEGSPIKGLNGYDDGAVRAYVFACDSCGDDSFVGFLERFDDTARQMQKRLGDGEEVEDEAEVLHALTSGHWIRPDDSDRWVPFNSDEGKDLRRKVIDRCDGKRPMACLP